MPHANDRAFPSRPTSSPPNSPDLRVAVVGCGFWGPALVRTLASLPGCRVTAVDKNPRRLQEIAARHPAVQIQPDWQRVLANQEIQAVVVATPAETHFDLVRQSLAAGKHVLCEKPLCTRSADAAMLVEMARHKHLVLMTGHVYLFHPAVEFLKRTVDGGQLGTLRHITSLRANFGPVRRDVNVAFDLAVHDIAIFNWLTGSTPYQVTATGRAFLQPGCEDVAWITLHYPGNILAAVQSSWLSPKKVRQITLVGSRRMATCDELADGSPVTIYDRQAIAASVDDTEPQPPVALADGAAVRPTIESVEPLRAECQYFLDAIVSGRLQRSTGPFSVGVVKILEAVAQSMQRDGMPIRINQAVTKAA